MDDIQDMAMIQMQIALNKRMREVSIITDAVYKQVQDELQTRLARLHAQTDVSCNNASHMQ